MVYTSPLKKEITGMDKKQQVYVAYNKHTVNIN